MSLTLGLGVAAGRLRAVVARGGEAVWASEVALPGDDAMASALADVLADAPLPRWPRPRAVAAIGPSRAQTRRISGLPPVGDERMLAQIVREGAPRFFLANGKTLATTGVRVEEPGRAWCAAFDEPTVRAVEAACAAAGLRLSAVVPAVAVLPQGLAGDTHVWRDGDAAAEVHARDGVMVGTRRLPRGESDDATASPPTAVPALAKLGPDAWRFADAFGAALLSRDEELVLRPGKGAAGAVPAWRVALAAGALAASLAAALFLPVVSASRAGAEAAARADSLRDRRRTALVAEAELRRVTAALAEVAAFDASRRPTTVLLAELTRALPDGAAMVALRVDSAGGSLVAVAPRAPAVLMPLERVPGVRVPEIVGPVTREVMAGREVERVTVRFALDTVPAPVAEENETEAEAAP